MIVRENAVHSVMMIFRGDFVQVPLFPALPVPRRITAKNPVSAARAAPAQYFSPAAI